jgi:peptidoglycan biosynthesis protein MviN/MurJ (putative lipid II flippase)
LSKPFELDKNTRTLMGIFVFGSLLNIIIVFPMIHILGLMGAVFSNTISLISIGILLFIRRGNSISIQIPWVIFGKVFIGVIIMISCLFLSDQFIPHGAGWIFLKMAIGIIFYACMILMMGLKRVLLI